MNVVVVIPMGPGHETLAVAAGASVVDAWQWWRGPFADMAIDVVDDRLGELGRSRARNRGIQRNPQADFYFLLDADDKMERMAFGCVDLDAPATFGCVKLEGINRQVPVSNVYPVTRETLLQFGARGTLSMGCFVRGDVARATPFDESLDVGEDFDFYLRLPGFVKIAAPLVSIGYDQPSAGGPRGYDATDWWGACDAVVQRYR